MVKEILEPSVGRCKNVFDAFHFFFFSEFMKVGNWVRRRVTVQFYRRLCVLQELEWHRLSQFTNFQR